MRRIGYGLALLLFGAGISWAAQQAVVVSAAPDYDVGGAMPLTQTEGGLLRVACD